MPPEAHDHDEDNDSADEDVAVLDATEGDDDNDRGDVVATVKPAATPAEATAEDDQAEATADRTKATKPVAIPKARFDEVNSRAQALSAENSRLQAIIDHITKTGGAPAEASTTQAADTAKAVDIDALEDQYAEALLDGNTKLAKEVRTKINAEVLRQAREDSTRDVLQAITARDDKTAFDSAVADLTKTYSQIDHSKPDHDAAAIGEVVEWREFLISSRGMSRADALREAVDRVARDRGWKTTQAAAVVDKDATTPQQQRTAAARSVAAAANLAQAPGLSSYGTGERRSRAEQLDVANMTDEEFDALPAAERKKLRGDGN